MSELGGDFRNWAIVRAAKALGSVLDTLRKSAPNGNTDQVSLSRQTTSRVSSGDTSVGQLLCAINDDGRKFDSLEAYRVARSFDLAEKLLVLIARLLYCAMSIVAFWVVFHNGLQSVDLDVWAAITSLLEKLPKP